ncbi:glycosyltransferase family 4 protein, partial [Candidatus Dependentiae bacterium]|nr:glycosyltransferase family 4 protein [Candidatus Dependentiae bacterium]
MNNNVINYTIDATYTLSEKTGIGYFIDGLISGLKKTDKVNNYNLFYNCIFPGKYGIKNSTIKNFKNYILRIPRRWLIKIWGLNFLSANYLLPATDIFVCTGLHIPSNIKSKIISIIYDISFKTDDITYSSHEKKTLDTLIKKILVKSDLILTSSVSTKNDLIKYYGYPENKIEILYGALSEINVNINQLTLDSGFAEKISKKNYYETGISNIFEKNTDFFLFIGSIEKRKNLGIICEALKSIKNTCEFKIVIAGKKSNDFNNIIEKIKDYGLTDKFIFTGYIHDQEKYVLLKNCLAVLYPSIYEGFGYPALESYYFEKPLITTKNGSIPEIAGDAAFYIDHDNPSQLLKTMLLIYNNRNTSEFIDKDKFKSQLKKFSWEKSAQ